MEKLNIKINKLKNKNKEYYELIQNLQKHIKILENNNTNQIKKQNNKNQYNNFSKNILKYLGIYSRNNDLNNTEIQNNYLEKIKKIKESVKFLPLFNNFFEKLNNIYSFEIPYANNLDEKFDYVLNIIEDKEFLRKKNEITLNNLINKTKINLLSPTNLNTKEQVNNIDISNFLLNKLNLKSEDEIIKEIEILINNSQRIKNFIEIINDKHTINMDKSLENILIDIIEIIN